MKRLVALTGAGISAESGISTFRDSNGLWEGHDVMEVASPEGWHKNKELVLDFYNQRRKQALSSKPNDGHKTLANLENDFDITIITQNVDNLHEKAGSSHVLHLHGELFKSRSTADDSLVYDMEGWELNLGDKCEKGSQLRPHIVWFGEMVPMIEAAVEYVLQADIFVVVGTSMVVYPAAGLINYVRTEIPKFIIDPNIPDIQQQKNMYLYEEKAGTGMLRVAKLLREKYC
ncbi:NAD-dependent deacylase [Reichenbachiella sp. MALMAid0571]|uniref:SIR2 family NAD-dependent protein deacylase n=1 Tax=Reichenbachiella sp. MALMAid0571 TaxID=3143939 RepID=UPI0032DFC219